MTQENLIAAKENREYRSSIFADLFYEDETADENDRALYNALHEEPLPEGTEIRRLRLEKSIYVNFKNDVSFGIKNKVVVFSEHQSTINFNMPLRGLMYIGRAYEQLVPVRLRYRKMRVMIPTPEFYTFYNGEEDYPAESTLHISDSYQMEAGENSLELSVKVININKSKNHELLEKCPILNEYAQFMECIEKYKESGAENAIELAINECIHNNILRDYLSRKGAEVVNMLIAEYDYQTDIEVQREEAMEIATQRERERTKAERERASHEIEELKSKLEQQKIQSEQRIKELTEKLEKLLSLSQS